MAQLEAVIADCDARRTEGLVRGWRRRGSRSRRGFGRAECGRALLLSVFFSGFLGRLHTLPRSFRMRRRMHLRDEQLRVRLLFRQFLGGQAVLGDIVALPIRFRGLFRRRLLQLHLLLRFHSPHGPLRSI